MRRAFFNKNIFTCPCSVFSLFLTSVLAKRLARQNVSKITCLCRVWCKMLTQSQTQFLIGLLGLHHSRFTALFPGPPRWADARRELLDFMVQGKINRGRHTDHPAGRHSIQTKQCPPPPSGWAGWWRWALLSSIFFYRPDALPASQPSVSKHWRQLIGLLDLILVKHRSE